jgi:hypothetical protein
MESLFGIRDKKSIRSIAERVSDKGITVRNSNWVIR